MTAYVSSDFHELRWADFCMEPETTSWSERFLELNMRVSASSILEKRRACLFCVPKLRSRSASTPAVDGLVMAVWGGTSKCITGPPWPDYKGLPSLCSEVTLAIS